MIERAMPQSHGRAILDLCGDYRPGDLPPTGYLNWCAWAEVQRRAGIKQRQCCMCSLWKTPQEMSAKTIKHTAYRRNGEAMHFVSPVCKSCAAN